MVPDRLLIALNGTAPAALGLREPAAARGRIDRHADLSALVPIAGRVLAAGAAGGDRLPARLVAVAALPYRRNRSRRRARIVERLRAAAGARTYRQHPSLMLFDRN